MALHNLEKLEPNVVVIDVDLLVPSRRLLGYVVVLFEDLNHQLIKFWEICLFFFYRRVLITFVALDESY